MIGDLGKDPLGESHTSTPMHDAKIGLQKSLIQLQLVDISLGKQGKTTSKIAKSALRRHLHN